MTYDEAIAFWFGRINYEVRSARTEDLKLERMRALLHLLGDPHDRLRIVHITGTKGKGSTAAMLASILRAAGYRVGLFTSPHLYHVEERVQVDGEPITQRELAARIAEIAPAVRTLEEAGSRWPAPTFFEIGTALGFLHFCYRRVDIAIVEVGLGGRFDSTNVCRPLVSVITSIGLDHTAQLGDTLEAIAFQKAGIIKRGVPVVSGVIEPGPRDRIRCVAAELGVTLHECDREFGWNYRQDASGPLVQVATPRADYGWMHLGLLGAHQAHNAALAVATVEFLRDAGFTISQPALTTGLARLNWPARIEVLSREPVVILDTAHNVPSALALVETLRESFPSVQRKAVVFAVSSDKHYAEILQILAGYFDHFHLTKYGNNPRCVAPEKLAEVLTSVMPMASLTIHSNSGDAWQAALAAARSSDLVCATGSVFLAGELSIMRTTERHR